MAPLSQTVHGVVHAQCYISLYGSHLHTRYSYDALKFGMPVLRCTHQNYDWLTMAFERRHCVESPREMDVGNTAIYQLDSRYSPVSPYRRLTDATHSAFVPLQSSIRDYDCTSNYLGEFDCQINELQGPSKVHPSEYSVDEIVDLLRPNFACFHSDLVALAIPYSSLQCLITTYIYSLQNSLLEAVLPRMRRMITESV